MTDNVSVPRLRRIIWKPNATFNDRVRCWAWLNDNNYDVIDAYTCRGVIIYTVTK